MAVESSPTEKQVAGESIAASKSTRRGAGRGQGPDARAERGNRGKRVLVVDDNIDSAESLADVIRMLGHAADVAYDGPSAVEKAQANPPHVVLCDIGLPGMDGYAVAQALRATQREGMRLVALSGYAQPEDVMRALAAGFDAHLAKPCDPELVERLLS